MHLYNPAQLSSLYPQLAPSERWKSAARSRLYLAPDKDDFPLLRRARCLEVRLTAGQMLYIPAGWWHEVLTPRFCIAINFWFKPHDCARFRPTILHLHSDLYAKRALAAAGALTATLKRPREGAAELVEEATLAPPAEGATVPDEAVTDGGAACEEVTSWRGAENARRAAAQARSSSPPRVGWTDSTQHT